MSRRYSTSSSNADGRDRVEAGGRLVEEQDRRVERQRAGERRALDHAAGELRRVLRRRLERQPDHAQPQLDQARERASSRSSASTTGSVMFSATVSEVNSAPCWNVTP